MVVFVSIICWTLLIHVIWRPPRIEDEHLITSTGASRSTPDLKSALLKYASPVSAVIFLSPADYGFREMALNLYKTSYARFKLTNHLFVSMDNKLCEYLKIYGANCAQYLGVDIENATTASEYGTDDFRRKVHTKANIIMVALMLHIRVVLVDCDIVFLRDPFPYMNCYDCDLVIGTAGAESIVNAGFYSINPTPNSKLLLRGMMDLFKRDPTINEQSAFNYIMNTLKKLDRLKYVVLNESLFQTGNTFFKHNRIFRGDQPCEECVTIHNNWIIGYASKIYRFKEYGLWEVDTDGYYSSPERKYISYDNPSDTQKKEHPREQENDALRIVFTIAYLLNRTVIVPKFHSGGETLSMLQLYDIEDLDTGLKNCYRESTFLGSDLVPEQIKSSVSETFFIRSGSQISQYYKEPAGVHILTSSGESITVSEIINWFAGKELSEVSVLRFYSLYNKLSPDQQTEFISKKLDKFLSRKYI